MLFFRYSYKKTHFCRLYFFFFSYSINSQLFVLFSDTQKLSLNLWLIFARLICGLRNTLQNLIFKKNRGSFEVNPNYQTKSLIIWVLFYFQLIHFNFFLFNNTSRLILFLVSFIYKNKRKISIYLCCFDFIFIYFC